MSTFLDVVELLITNSDAKASYADNPNAFLESHGLDTLDPTDVADAMQYAGDALPLPVALLLDPEAGLDSAAAVDLEAQDLSLEREAFIQDPDSTLDEDVPFDNIDESTTGDGSPNDVVDELDAADHSVGESIEMTTDNDEPEPLTIDPAIGPDVDSDVDSADYLTDTSELDEIPYDDTNSFNNASLDETGSIANDHLDSTDLHDDTSDDFDLLD